MVWYAKVTRAATTSSTIGPYTVSFTDNTDSTTNVLTAQGQNSAGASGTTIATNSVTATGIIQGTMTVNAKGGTNIQHALTYVSSGATTMQYELHVRVEAL